MILPALALTLLFDVDPTPVVISTDCGCEMDDQWAIAHMCLSPSIDVRAILTSHAPKLASPKAEASASVVRDVLFSLPLKSKPAVIPGSNEPLHDRLTPRKSAGVDRLLKESDGFSRNRRLTVVQMGPATDVASALLIDPTISGRITVIAMAFDGWPNGGDPFNVRNDVAAWQILIDSPVPLTVVDGSVCLRNLKLTRAQAEDRFAARGPAGALLFGYLKHWLDLEPKLARAVTGSPDTWPVWDCGTVAVVLGFTHSEENPRPRLRDDRTFNHDQSQGTIRWVTSIDSDALWRDLALRLLP